MQRKFIFIALLFQVFGFSQDPIYTQSFLVPQTINPGFVGVSETTSAGIIHRTQWPELNLKLNTNYAYFSTWLDDEHIGIGVNIMSHKENFTNYNFIQTNINMSYRIPISDDWYFRPGIEFGYGNKNFGFKNLILGDQLNLNNETTNTFSSDPLVLNNRIDFFDFSTGLLFYNDQIKLGVTFKHLTQPNISIIENNISKLNILSSLNASYEFNIGDYFNTNLLPYDTRIAMHANYMTQGSFHRLDVGSSLIFNNFYMGLVGATNPKALKKTPSYLLTSLNPYLGLKYENFQIGFSYDINTSNIGKTKGVFELVVVYRFDAKAKNCFGCPNYWY